MESVPPTQGLSSRVGPSKGTTCNARGGLRARSDRSGGLTSSSSLTLHQGKVLQVRQEVRLEVRQIAKVDQIVGSKGVQKERAERPPVRRVAH